MSLDGSIEPVPQTRPLPSSPPPSVGDQSQTAHAQHVSQTAQPTSASTPGANQAQHGDSERFCIPKYISKPIDLTQGIILGAIGLAAAFYFGKVSERQNHYALLLTLWRDCKDLPDIQNTEPCRTLLRKDFGRLFGSVLDRRDFGDEHFHVASRLHMNLFSELREKLFLPSDYYKTVLLIWLVDSLWRCLLLLENKSRNGSTSVYSLPRRIILSSVIQSFASATIVGMIALSVGAAKVPTPRASMGCNLSAIILEQPIRRIVRSFSDSRPGSKLLDLIFASKTGSSDSPEKPSFSFLDSAISIALWYNFHPHALAQLTQDSAATTITHHVAILLNWTALQMYFWWPPQNFRIGYFATPVLLCCLSIWMSSDTISGFG